MSPSMKNSHQALASTQMLASVAPYIRSAAAALVSVQSGKVLHGYNFRGTQLCFSVNLGQVSHSLKMGLRS